MSTVPVPFAVRPREVAVIWGGDALVQRFGKPGEPGEAIGESWECWDENPASGGPYAGETIAQLRVALGNSLMGDLDATRAFPVLTKFIDARQPLSVQVHPDDAYAQRVEHQPNGKTECWVVLEAERNAEIVLGWTRDIGREEYVRRVADGTLGDVLRKVPVRAGDAFYLAAGTVHSIGAGIVLYETQQTSDLTYRIFDWNRLDADGKPRRLDVEKAADVLTYSARGEGALSSLAYTLDGTARTAIVADPRFVVERVSIGSAPARIDLEGTPLVVTAMGVPVAVDAGSASLELGPYETAVVPAALGVATLVCPQASSVLTVAPLGDPGTLERRLERAGTDASRRSAFLGQFVVRPPTGR